MAELVTEFGIGAKDLPDGFVHIKCRIRYLKRENSIVGKNADIRRPIFTERGFHIIIVGHDKGRLKDKVYMPFVVQLPHEIVPDECKIDAEVEDDFVILSLKKKDQNKAWNEELSDGKLENAEPEEIKKFLDARIRELVSQGVIENQDPT